MSAVAEAIPQFICKDEFARRCRGGIVENDGELNVEGFEDWFMVS
jgi:hypothetical protein